MANKTKIEWTEYSWNPVTGCTKISDGCLNCYAEKFAKRLKAMGNPRYKNGFNITIHEDLIAAPLTWKTPHMVFVNSMSDLFHESIPDEIIWRIFGTMNSAHWHTFQVLTKRSQRLLDLSAKLKWTSNIWMGVTVENIDVLYRVDHLRQTGAKIKFISAEPLITGLSAINLNGIDWVIVGGESGPSARPMKPEWVTEIKDQCLEIGIPFFFKQWGGTNKKKAGRLLEGRAWDGMPELVSRLA
ncbi:MAG: phage Gp37/Gp68 family protein [Firmicutes bacterium]|nr:phage Gp37/Gp68 family protein [Bacillota bacterium]